MKKFILFIFVIMLCSCKNVFAEIRMIDRTGYGYTVDGKHYTYNLYYDEETNYPLFRLDYGTEYEEGFFFTETNDSIYTKEELETIKDSIYYITDGRKFSELSMTELIGIQALIWDVYSTHTSKVLQWTCDTGFLVDYLPLMAKKKEEHNTPSVYNYEARVNNELKVNFLPFMKEDYYLEETFDNMQVIKNKNEFIFTPKKIGNYTYTINSDSFNENVKLFKGEHSSLIELIKIRDPKPIININVLEEEKTYKVNGSFGEGIHVSFSKDSYLEGEEVEFSYNLEEGYVIDSITYNGVELINNSFKYSKDGLLAIKTKKVPIKRNITYISDSNIIVNNKSVYEEGASVSLDYEILNGYTLDKIELIMKDKTMVLDKDTFVMPSSDVVIHFVLKKDEYYQIYYQNDLVDINLNDKYREGEIVNLRPIVLDGYTIKEMFIIREDGSELAIDDNSFVMPNSNVYLKILVEPNTIKTLDDVPKTGDIRANNVFIDLVYLSCFSLVVLIKKMLKV